MKIQTKKRSFLKAIPALLAVTFSVASAAFAGPLQDANDAYKRGDYRTAATLSQQAINEDPQNASGYVALGTSLRRLGDKEGARQAWDNVIRLDPNLRSIKDDAGFLRAYRAVGGDPSRASQGDSGSQGTNQASRAARGQSEANAIINALTTGSVYVHPDLAGEVDASRIEAATQATAPTVVKVVVVPKLGPYPSRAAFAEDIRKQLNLGENGAVIVATPKGISGVSERLSSAQADEAFEKAGIASAFASGGLNEAIPVAVKAFNGEVTSDRRGDANRTGTIGLLALAAVGGGIGIFAMKRKKEMDDARGPIEELRQEVIKNLSYVDGYLDLLPKAAEAEQARRSRASAYEKFAAATGMLKQAKRPEEVRQAHPLLANALQELEACRQDIDRATGGTGVAMAIPEIPDLSTDETRARRFRKVEELRNKADADRLQQEIQDIPERDRGVSFFSGQPMPKEALVPVTIVIDGQKRTVMATRDEAEQIRRGETPAVRAFPDNNGRYIPWYENRGYDPYRDYYGGWGGYGSGLGTFVDLMLLSHLFSGGGFFGGYGGWGGWGHGQVINNNYYYGDGYGGNDNGGGFGGFFGGGDNTPQYDPTPEHSGGFDFFGQGGYNEQSDDGGFGFGGFGDSGDGGGGFDFGGGDFGGGDFGGGDFGGD